MAEPAKQLQRERLKVISIATREGGLDMGPLGVKTHLPGALKGIDMEFDRTLGGVVVRWSQRGLEGKTINKLLVVPLGHIRQYELES